MGAAGGVVWSYSTIDFSQVDALYQGLWDPSSLGITMDGTALDTLTFNSIVGSSAYWTGTTDIYHDTGSPHYHYGTPVHFKLTTTGGANLFDATSLSFEGGAYASLGAMWEVTGDYTIQMEFFTGSIGSTTVPADWNVIEGSLQTSFSPGFYYKPVPEPTTMLLLGTGLIGLAGARRRMKK